MALKQQTDAFGNSFLVNDKGFVFEGTPNVGAHGKNAFSEHLFKPTGQTVGSYTQQLQSRREQEQQAKLMADRAAFNEKQKGQEQDFLNRFTGAIGGLEGLDVMRERLSKDLNIAPTREAFTGLTQAVGNLQNTLATLPQRVEGETRGFDVNQAQLGKIQEQRAMPLQQNLGQLANAMGTTGTVLNTLEGELGNRLQVASQQQERSLIPFQAEASMLSDRLAREVTGFNADREAELGLLLNKIEFGQNLTLEEIKQANALAVAEQSFLNERENLSYKSDLDFADSQRLLPLQKELESFKTDLETKKALAIKAAGGGSITEDELDEEWSIMEEGF